MPSVGEAGHIGWEPNGVWPNLEAPRIARDAPRPATILRVADALEYQGGEVTELFREVGSGSKKVVFPIHLTRSGHDFFVEVETGRWTPQVVRSVVRRVALLRATEEGERAEVMVLSAYPIPAEVSRFAVANPHTLLQLAMLDTARKDDPESVSETLVAAVRLHLDTDIKPAPEYLPLVEEIMSPIHGTPVLDGFAFSLGCYLGETLRASLLKRGVESSWQRRGEWGDEVTLRAGDFDLDPVGKAQAFLDAGSDDSLVFYTGYALAEIEAAGNLRSSGGEVP